MDDELSWRTPGSKLITGFAMDHIDEATARQSLAFLADYTS